MLNLRILELTRLRPTAALRALALIAALLCATACVTETDGKGPRLGTDVQRVNAQLELAKGYLQNKDLNGARTALERALSLDGSAWEAYDLMATVHMLDGEPALAEASWKSAIRHNGGARPRRNYASYLMANRRFADACPLLRTAATALDYANRAQVFEDLGQCELQIGQDAAAMEAFNRAIELNVAQPAAQLALAELLYKQGNFAQSFSAYQQYRSHTTQNARSLWLGVRLGRAMHDADAEASHALLLRNQYPDSPEYRLYQESRP